MRHRASARELSVAVALLLAVIAACAVAYYVLGLKDDPAYWFRTPAGIVTLVTIWAVLLVSGVREWRKLRRLMAVAK